MENEKPILGWRSWRLNSGTLEALTNGVKWIPGVNRAECKLLAMGGEPEIPGTAPHTNHHCGFNAFYLYEDAWYYRSFRNSSQEVIGLMAGAGRLEMHSSGYRSEQAMIIGLLDSPKDSVDLTEAKCRYDIPVFDTPEELIEYGLNYGVEIGDLIKDYSLDNGVLTDWQRLVIRPDGGSEEPSVALEDGTKQWYKNGRLHRENLPAEIAYHPNGEVQREAWFKNGKLHRDGDLPAEITYSKDKEVVSRYWYENNSLHREEGPAAIYDNASFWFQNGEYHRIDGPAVVWHDEGREEYWVGGERHRLDGPAVVSKTTQEYWQQGERHRLDGPAVVRKNGESEYWVGGVCQLNPGLKLTELTHISGQSEGIERMTRYLKRQYKAQGFLVLDSKPTKPLNREDND